MKQQTLVQPKKPEAQKPSAPSYECTALALGKTTQGLHCVALLTLSVREGAKYPSATDLRVTSARVVDVSKDQEKMEEAWQDNAYPVLYHGETASQRQGHTFASGTALGLLLPPKTLRSMRTATRFEVEGERVTDLQVIFDGGKLHAWEELSDHASRHLLTVTAAQRRKRAQ